MASNPSSPSPADAGRANRESRPSNWAAALLTLVSDRFALIQLEAKQTAGDVMRRVIGLATVVVCLFFSWALLLAGAIAATAAMTSWQWYYLAIGAAALHLFAAILLAKVLSKPAAPAFAVTRAEFQKDREWIENLQKKPKSNA